LTETQASALAEDGLDVDVVQGNGTDTAPISKKAEVLDEQTDV